jgi:UDP-N-acetylglucosamine acyltransferase
MPAVAGRIHPTAIIDPEAQLADDVLVDAYAIIEGQVKLGPECIVRARAHLLGPFEAGAGNDFGIGCVVGERAQHLLHADFTGGLSIGEGNTFREYVTIHRGTPDSRGTRVGDRNFLMVNTHVAHDSTLGNHCVFANGAVVGGHVKVDDGAFLSGNTGVHQNCHIGRLAMISACSSATKDVPPFAIHEGRNTLIGVNLIGMKRAGMGGEQIAAVRQAYRLLLNSGLIPAAVLPRIEKELGHIDAVQELLKFFHTAKRGVCLTRARRLHGNKASVEA